MSESKKPKKFYLSEKAAWYLERIKAHDGKTYGEVIDILIAREAMKHGLPADPTPEQLATRPAKP